jgi:ATP-dependent DNA helicase RecG
MIAHTSRFGDTARVAAWRSLESAVMDRREIARRTLCRVTEALILTERVAQTAQLGESHFREYKSALQGPQGAKVPRPGRDVARDIGDALVAFANADGGELLVGVEDDGAISGIPSNYRDLELLMNAPQTHAHAETPLSAVQVALVNLGDERVLYFSIDKGTTTVHQTADGRCLQRRDRATIPVAFERLLLDRQERRSREYDREYVDEATMADLSGDVVEAISRELVSGLSAEKTLQYLSLADFQGGRLRLRRAAVLLFATEIERFHPRSQLRVLRIAGTELKTGREYNVVKDETARGNVMQLVSRGWDLLRPHLVRTKLASGGVFAEQIMYPEDACREALVNAVAHRDYAVEGQGIEVSVFDDRMEVRSPGSLLSSVSLAGLRRGEGVHESRNAHISRVLRELGYMREMGEGIRRLFSLLQVSDLQAPEIDSTQAAFAITLHHQSVFTEGDARWIASYEPFDLSREERLVVLLGRAGDLVSPQQIWDTLGLVDTEDFRAIVSALQEKGLLLTAVPKQRASSMARRHRITVRMVPRFAIRPAREALAELVELEQAIATAGPLTRVTSQLANRVLTSLPEANQYRRGRNVAPLRKLGLLGFVDAEGVPTPRMGALWRETHAVALNGPSRTAATAIPNGPPRTASTPIPGSPQTGSTAIPNMPPLRASTAIPSIPPPTASPLTSRRRRSYYVGNLPDDVRAEELRDLFGECGRVIGVKLPTDFLTGKTRGFAFVDIDAVKSNCFEDELILRGRALDIQVARLQP